MKSAIKHLALASLVCATALQASEALLTEADTKKNASITKSKLWNADHQVRCAWILAGFHTRPAVNAPLTQKQIQNDLPVSLTKSIEEFALGTKQKTLFISAHAKELAPAFWSTGCKGPCDSIFFYLNRLRTSDSKPEILSSNLIAGTSLTDTLNIGYNDGSRFSHVILTEQQHNNLEHLNNAQLKHIVQLWQIRKENEKNKDPNNHDHDEWILRFKNASNLTLTPQQSVRHQAFQKAAEVNPVLRTMLAHLERNYTIKLTEPEENSALNSTPALEGNNISN